MKKIFGTSFASWILNTLRATFNFRPGEGRPLSLLLIHSFALTIGVQVSYIAGTAMFLAKFDVDSLPYVYIGSGLVVAAVGYVYEKLAMRHSVVRLWTVGLSSILCSLAAFWGVFAFTDSKWPAMAFLMWWEAIECLAVLEFWALAGRIFNLRQAKRLFPLIGCGGEIAVIPAGFAIPLIVPIIGTQNLLILAAVGVIISLFLMVYIVRIFSDRVSVAGEDERKEERGAAFADLVKSRYIRLIFVVSTMTVLMFYLLDFAYYDQAETHFPDEVALAGFFGIYSAVQSIACLILRTIGGRAINRYGLTLGVLGLPVMILLGATPAAAVGSFAAFAGILFWMVIATRFFDDMMRSVIEEPSVLILYQPLPSEQRLGAQAAVEGRVKPMAGMAIGVVLLGLTRMFEFKTIHALYMLLAILAVWIFFAVLLRREYTTTLTRALSKRFLGGHRLSLEDSSSVEVVEKGLSSPYPGQVIYCLKMLEESEHESFERFIVNSLDHASPEVRGYAAQTIERRGLNGAMEAVTLRLGHESDPGVRGLLIRAVCALGEVETDLRMQKFLDDPEPEVRRGALVGLLRSGGIEGVLSAGDRFLSLTHSTDPQERVLAGRILEDVRIHSFYSPLLNMLNDESVSVRRQAIKAAGEVSNPRLWPILIEKLADDTVDSYAGAALMNAGPELVSLLEAAFDRPDQSNEVRVWLVRICGHLEGPKSQAMLIKKISFADETVRGQILTSLRLRNFQAGDREESVIRDLLQKEVGDAAWTLAALMDVGDSGHAQILARALRHELFLNQDRIFLLLSFLYPPEPILRARANMNIASHDKRAYAIEVVDSLLPQDLKALVIPLLDDIPPDQRLLRLRALFPQATVGRAGRLKLLITRPLALSSVWTKACAVYVSAMICFEELRDDIVHARQDPHPLVRETAEWMLAAKGTTGMLLTIEKVMILKSVRIFSETPDKYLVDVANILKEAHVKAGAEIFKKGDVGTSMYVIVNGKIRVHDGSRDLAVLEGRDVFGELAALDPEPRLASATAVEDTHLFCLEGDALYELLAENVKSRGQSSASCASACGP